VIVVKTPVPSAKAGANTINTLKRFKICQSYKSSMKHFLR
jgi:hypothetical protein